jgi:hypothetical protein
MEPDELERIGDLELRVTDLEHRVAQIAHTLLHVEKVLEGIAAFEGRVTAVVENSKNLSSDGGVFL